MLSIMMRTTMWERERFPVQQKPFRGSTLQKKVYNTLTEIEITCLAGAWGTVKNGKDEIEG